MTIYSMIERFRNAFSSRIPGVLRQAVLTGLLAGLIWLPGFSIGAASAAPAAMATERASQSVDAAAAKSDRLDDLIACLPSQLSQPNFKRALSEMGNDQLERAFNLKTNPKLSQAEIELATCLNR